MIKRKVSPNGQPPPSGPRPIDMDMVERGPNSAAERVELALMAGGSKTGNHLARECLRSETRGAQAFMNRLLNEMMIDGLLTRSRDPKDQRVWLWRWAEAEKESPTPEPDELPEWITLSGKPSKLSDPSQPAGAMFHYSCSWRREREGHIYTQAAGQGFDIKSLTKQDWIAWLQDIKFYLRGYIPEPPRQTRWFGPKSVSQILLMLYESGKDFPGNIRDVCSDIVRVESPGAPTYSFLPETCLWQSGVALFRPGHAFHHRAGAQSIQSILRGGKYMPPPDVAAQLSSEIARQFHGSQGVQQEAPRAFDWTTLT